MPQQHLALRTPPPPWRGGVPRSPLMTGLSVFDFVLLCSPASISPNTHPPPPRPPHQDSLYSAIYSTQANPSGQEAAADGTGSKRRGRATTRTSTRQKRCWWCGGSRGASEVDAGAGRGSRRELAVCRSPLEAAAQMVQGTGVGNMRRPRRQAPSC